MELALTPQETDEIRHSLQKFFATEFELELTDLKARQLLEYIGQEIAPFAYNQGIKDAEAFFRTRLEDLSATCYEPALTYWQKKRK